MHGYDVPMNMLHGPPPPSSAQMTPIESNPLHHHHHHHNHHHPDSTDSYVTYLESDESIQGSP